MSVYAKKTKVPVSNSEAEIRRIITRYGAKSFAIGFTEGEAVVMFEAHDRRVKFVLPMTKKVKEWSYAARASVDKSVPVDDRERRSRWRALVLVIKAKLEAVDSGITTFESEFLAHIILPGGMTIGQTLVPRLAGIYDILAGEA